MKPFKREDGFGANVVQIFVTLTDKTTGKSGSRMIIEALDGEANCLCGRFRIKKDKLIVFPRTKWIEIATGDAYRERGFSVPIQVPLDEIF